MLFFAFLFPLESLYQIQYKKCVFILSVWEILRLIFTLVLGIVDVCLLLILLYMWL